MRTLGRCSHQRDERLRDDVKRLSTALSSAKRHRASVAAMIIGQGARLRCRRGRRQRAVLPGGPSSPERSGRRDRGVRHRNRHGHGDDGASCAQLRAVEQLPPQTEKPLDDVASGAAPHVLHDPKRPSADQVERRVHQLGFPAREVVIDRSPGAPVAPSTSANDVPRAR